MRFRTVPSIVISFLLAASCSGPTHAGPAQVVLDDLSHQVNLSMDPCPTTASVAQAGVAGLAPQVATRDFEAQCSGTGSVTGEVGSGVLTITTQGTPDWGIFFGYGVDQNWWLTSFQLIADSSAPISVEVFDGLTQIGARSVSSAGAPISIMLDFAFPVQLMGSSTLGAWIYGSGPATVSDFIVTQVDPPPPASGVVSEPGSRDMMLTGLACAGIVTLSRRKHGVCAMRTALQS